MANMSTNLDMPDALTFDKADRIRRAMRVSGIGVMELAEALQVSRNSIGNWINGHNEPRRRDLMAIALRTGFPYQWLETGTVPGDPEDGPNRRNLVP